MIIRSLLITGVLLLLAACAGCPARNIVAVPISATLVRIKIPPKPILLSTHLTKDSTPMQVEKAQVTDLDAMIVYSKQLLKLLKEFQ
jgi:hypothetical protein